MTHLTKERLKTALHWIGTCPNAPKHFTKHGNEINRETITEAIQTLIDAKAAPTWQPIESAPKDGSGVIIFDSFSPDKTIDGYGCITARYDHTLKNWVMHQRYGFTVQLVNPTHWMPLPTPPEKSE